LNRLKLVGSRALSFKRPLLSVDVSVCGSVIPSVCTQCFQNVSSPALLVGIVLHFNIMFPFVSCYKFSIRILHPDLMMTFSNDVVKFSISEISNDDICGTGSSDRLRV